MPTIPNIIPPPLVDNRISGPTVITEPGHYVVVQNICATTGPIIRIQTHNVYLDLGGYTLTLPRIPSALEVIAIDPGYSNISIKDGILDGGYYGIKHESTGSDQIRVQIKNLTVQDFAYRGIFLDCLSAIDLLDSRIISTNNSGVQLAAGATPCTAQILRNTFRCADTYVCSATGINGALIKDNQLYAESDVAGFRLKGNANIVERNAIAKVHGYPISMDGNNNLILNNTIGSTFMSGIRVQNNNNYISGNIVGGGLDGSGVLIEGSDNLIENNTLGANQKYGIEFVSGANNAYRNNMLRGNRIAPVQDTLGNTDAGGNIV